MKSSTALAISTTAFTVVALGTYVVLGKMPFQTAMMAYAVVPVLAAMLALALVRLTSLKGEDSRPNLAP
jgi:hypothetical protein